MAKRQLTTPLELVEALPEFEGLPTIAVSLEVRGVEGGFNDGLTISPVVLHRGDEVNLVMRGVVEDILHKVVKDADGWRRAHVLRVDAGFIVDAAAVDGLLADQRARVKAAVIEAEKLEGIHRLPLTGDGDEDDEDAVMARQHNGGGHQDGLRPGCSLCRLEAEFAAEENGTTVEEELEARKAPAS